MSSADAASVSVASSSSTSASLSPSSSGTTQVDPPSELHAPHSTPSTHVPSNSHTNTVDAVLDSPVTGLTSDVGEDAFMIVEGESQDGSVDDAGHESVDVQGREGVMVMDSGDDGQQWFPEHENHELKRVKVYELIESRWVDQGTALCFGQYEDGEAALVAKAEANMSEIILKTTIRSSDVYQRQQDTLIVWTEPDGVDYALSFQDPEGCMELWNFILEVQSLRANSGDQQAESSSPLTGPEPSITTASIIRTGHLPQPALGIIMEIDRAIRTLCRTPAIKDKICEFVQRADYIKAMIDVMHQAEDLENLENLHSLCALVQTILMMSDHNMYDHILDDDRFFGVLGMLEYDPEFPIHKANYRDFLRHSTRYHQPVTIHDPLIQKKIHHTYRLLFLKDVVLARALDDSTFNVLSSCIIFNQIDIITHVQNDVQFLQDIVDLFLRPNPGPSISLNGTKNKTGASADTTSDPMSNGVDVDEDRRRREVILLIQQLCIMGKNVQLPTRMALFKTLVDRGIVHSVQWALSQPEGTEVGQQMIAVAGEVLITLLDHDVNGVREHVVKQCEGFEARESRDESLLTLLCGLMVRSRDLAVQTLVGDSLRLMLEMPPPEVNDVQTPAKPFSRTRDDARMEKFLDYFYKLCIHSLLKPIFDVPNPKQHPPDSNLILTREKTNLYLSLCDLLSTFALQHTFRSHFYMLTSGISSHVATLLSSKDKHLRLAALRFFRMHLKNNNRNFLNHLVKLETFKPIIELAIKESYRDTLVNSSCQEFFEFMRRENMKDVIAHVMTNYEDQVKQLSESRFSGQCFRSFVRRYEMNIHPPPEAEERPLPSQPSEIRRVDLAEESYFNTDDEEDDDNGDSPGPHPAPTSPTLPSPLLSPPLSRFQFAQKRRRQRTPGIPLRTGLAGGGGTQRVPVPATPIHLPRTPPINALVDYRDDDEPSSDPEDALLESLVSANKPASPAAGTVTTTTPAPAPVPTATTTTTTTTIGTSGGGFVPLRAEKRRRAEEDEDEMGLERLVSGKSRRPAKVAATAVGTGEEGPKRIRLRFGAASLVAAAASTLPAAARSEPGTKDGDTG
ncbi:component of IIS longevity pathway SMK-1-domain-containing protein [Lactarius hengduanensis]|nr:component of IIS longevity pathway SMK-1-domain-containing protein [Lactarius hengduanensis]